MVVVEDEGILSETLDVTWAWGEGGANFGEPAVEVRRASHEHVPRPKPRGYAELASCDDSCGDSCDELVEDRTYMAMPTIRNTVYWNVDVSLYARSLLVMLGDRGVRESSGTGSYAWSPLPLPLNNERSRSMAYAEFLGLSRKKEEVLLLSSDVEAALRSL